MSGRRQDIPGILRCSCGAVFEKSWFIKIAKRGIWWIKCNCGAEHAHTIGHPFFSDPETISKQAEELLYLICNRCHIRVTAEQAKESRTHYFVTLCLKCEAFRCSYPTRFGIESPLIIYPIEEEPVKPKEEISMPAPVETTINLSVKPVEIPIKDLQVYVCKNCKTSIDKNQAEETYKAYGFKCCMVCEAGL